MKTILQVLKANVTGADSIGRRKDGRYVLRRGFFFRHGMDADLYKKAIMHDIAKTGLSAHCFEHGEKWTAFNGGSSLANSSHWYVVVEIDNAR
jgi:hypothetical protein